MEITRYQKIFTKVYREILMQPDSFNYEKAIDIAFEKCPSDFTKGGIIRLTSRVVDAALDSGMLVVVGDYVYRSKLANVKTVVPAKPSDKQSNMVMYALPKGKPYIASKEQIKAMKNSVTSSKKIKEIKSNAEQIKTVIENEKNNL